MQAELERRKREDYKQLEMDNLYYRQEKEFGKPPPPIEKFKRPSYHTRNPSYDHKNASPLRVKEIKSPGFST